MVLGGTRATSYLDTNRVGSIEWMYKVLGLSKEERTELKSEVEKTALHCTAATRLWLLDIRQNETPKPLLDVSK